jgi:Flp pilus assembly pilin Flp
MSKLFEIFAASRKGRRGVSGLTYGLLAGLIAVVSLLAITGLGGGVSGLFDQAGLSLKGDVPTSSHGGGASCSVDSAGEGWTHDALSDGGTGTASRSPGQGTPPVYAVAFDDAAEISCDDGTVVFGTVTGIATECQLGYILSDGSCDDQTPPSLLSLTRFDPASETTNLDTLTFLAHFSEAVTGVDAGDFTVSGTTAAVSAVTGSDEDRQVTISGGDIAAIEGVVGIELAEGSGIEDVAGNPLDPVSVTPETYTLDHLAPSLVSLSRFTPPDAATNADALVFQAVFSKPVVDVDAADFTISGTTATITGLVDGGASWDITLEGGDLAALNGTVGLVLAETPVITDSAGNPLAAGTPTYQTYAVDNLAPQLLTLNRLTPAAQTTNADTLIFRASFNEAVTGVAAGSFTITGTTAIVSAVTGSAAQWDITLSGGDLAALNGTVGLGVSVTPGILDPAGNALGAGGSFQTYTLDNTAPAVSSLVRHSPSAQTTDEDSLVFRITFSETATGVDSADFGVSGTTAGMSSVSGSADTYDLTVSGGNLADLNGTVSLSVAGGVSIQDAAGNALSGGMPGGAESYIVANTVPAAWTFAAPSASTSFSSITPLSSGGMRMFGSYIPNSSSDAELLMIDADQTGSPVSARRMLVRNSGNSSMNFFPRQTAPVSSGASILMGYGYLFGQGSSNTLESMVVRIDSDGSFAWGRLIPFGASLRDDLHGVSLDSGSVLVAGAATGSSGPGWRGTIAKMSASTGSVDWAYSVRYNSGTNDNLILKQAIGYGGGVAAVGFWFVDPDRDPALITFNSGGTPQRMMRLTGAGRTEAVGLRQTGSQQVQIYGMDIDDNNNYFSRPWVLDVDLSTTPATYTRRLTQFTASAGENYGGVQAVSGGWYHAPYVSVPSPAAATILRVGSTGSLQWARWGGTTANSHVWRSIGENGSYIDLAGYDASGHALFTRVRAGDGTGPSGCSYVTNATSYSSNTGLTVTSGNMTEISVASVQLTSVTAGALNSGGTTTISATPAALTASLCP